MCDQAFGGLPKHVVGKAMVAKIRAVYPQANINPIDYDPSATKVNQENRIKLMIAVARENLEGSQSPSMVTAIPSFDALPKAEIRIKE